MNAPINAIKSYPLKALQWSALGGCAFALTSCMPSQYAYIAATPEKAALWMDECVGNNNDYLAKQRYCDLVIQSNEHVSDQEYARAVSERGIIYYEQGQYQAAVVDFTEAIAFEPRKAMHYENRAYAYEMLDEIGRAEADLATAERISNDPRYREIREAVVTQAEMREREQRQFIISYEGFSCRRIQYDGPIYPANEVKIQTFVYSADNADGAYAVDLPSANSSFGNVNAGHRDTRQNGPIWQGGIEPVHLSVVMWEHDDGGPIIDVAAFVLTEAAMAYVGAKAVPSTMKFRNIYRGGMIKTRAPSQGSSNGGFSPGLIDGAVGGVLKSAFGTDNDHMGTYHYYNLEPDFLSEQAYQRSNDFVYHIKTNHKHDGADCDVYFIVEETDPIR